MQTADLFSGFIAKTEAESGKFADSQELANFIELMKILNID
jgi:hypothetical protein